MRASRSDFDPKHPRRSPRGGGGQISGASSMRTGLVHTQKIEAQSEKPTWTKALEFTQFACPCGTDPRLLSGEQRTSHFKLVTSVDDPSPTSPLCYPGHAHALIDPLAFGEECWIIALSAVAEAADGKAWNERKPRLCTGSPLI